MKTIIQTSTLFALLAGSALAQTLVEVPFDFKVGERKMAAGAYTVSPATTGGVGPQFFFRERKSGKTTMVTAPVPLTRAGFGARRLVFDCGGVCELKEVWATPSFGAGRPVNETGRGITIEGR